MSVIQISMPFFCYNLAMAGISALFPPQISDFIESYLPIKGGWFSGLAYLILYRSNIQIFFPAFIRSDVEFWYEKLVMYSAVFIAVLEMTQVSNFTI